MSLKNLTPLENNMKFDEVVKIEQPQSILIYGASKTGKTELAAKLANEGYNLIWIDLENGKQTLGHAIRKEFYCNVEYIQIPDTSENPIAIETVGKLLSSKTAVSICEAHGKVTCAVCSMKKPTPGAVVTLDLNNLDTRTVLVIDTGTQLSDSALAYTMKKEIAKLFSAFERADYDAYMYQGMMLNSVFSNFQQKKCHRILITHEEIIPQTEGGNLVAPKCGTRNYSRTFPRFFDHVVYCYRSNKSHKVASSTEFHPKILTGSRSAIAMEKSGSLVDLLRAGIHGSSDALLAEQAGITADYGNVEIS